MCGACDKRDVANVRVCVCARKNAPKFGGNNAECGARSMRVRSAVRSCVPIFILLFVVVSDERVHNNQFHPIPPRSSRPKPLVCSSVVLCWCAVRPSMSVLVHAAPIIQYLNSAGNCLKTTPGTETSSAPSPLSTLSASAAASPAVGGVVSSAASPSIQYTTCKDDHDHTPFTHRTQTIHIHN